MNKTPCFCPRRIRLLQKVILGGKWDACFIDFVPGNKAKGKKVTCKNLHQLCIVHILLKPEESLDEVSQSLSLAFETHSKKKNTAPWPCGAYTIGPQSSPSQPAQNYIKPSLFWSAPRIPAQGNHKPSDENFSTSNLQKLLHPTLLSCWTAVWKKGLWERPSLTVPRRDWGPSQLLFLSGDRGPSLSPSVPAWCVAPSYRSTTAQGN